jgi:phage major head subunit gpT-like protein
MRGWTLANTTWQMWCNTGSLPDFKAATIAGLGAFPDLDTIPRSGGPYRHASMVDVGETAQLATYGKLFGISRESLINDDLNEFTRIPQAMGTAAARKVNYVAYQTLIANSYVGQTMTADSTALFDATHSNYIASGGSGVGAPSVATLNAALAAMRKQKAPLPSGDTSAAYLNIEPQYLLTVPDLEGTARVLIAAQWNPAGTTASTSKRDEPNPWKDRLEVIIEPQLTLATGWWLAAGQNSMVDTVTVFFLNGQQAPYIEEMDHGTNDGVTYKVRVDAVARALDYRGLYFNYGV